MISQFRERIVGMHYLNQWIVLILDTVASVLCTFLACILAGHLVPGTMGMSAVLKITLLAVPASGLSFYLFRIYRNIIRHSTLRELWRLVAASAVKLLLMAVVVFGMMLTDRQLLIGGLLDMLMTTVVLICMRVGMVLGYDVIVSKISKSNSRLLIYGVDDRSVSLETRMRNSKQYQIAGFYNYGKAYKSYRLADLPVYYFNDEQDFVHIVTRYNIEGILFPDYESIRTEKERLIRYCEMHHVRMLIAPPVDEVSGDKLVPGIREIKIEDLLGRDEINMEEEEVAAGFRDRTVLVTGAAGSIGSELCRQLASFGVGRLILFDSAETPMHNIRLELEERFPHLSFVPVIGDVRLKARVRMIFERHRPDVVFHAAAYKHVPLMEENPCEAVFVNAIGTQHVADLCVEYGVEKMVMISTDKAVNPTNVMGASKRLAEIYVQSLGVSIAEGRTAGRTRFVTTRFGNVLGSNGSVIPVFQRQIAAGGPLTVTHPDIERFFMTIPEASRLVIQAGGMAKGGEIFILDMGEPVKIVDLAKGLIQLQGLTPDVDVKIVFTGLREGEKMYEELLMDEESTLPTDNHSILISTGQEISYTEVAEKLDELEAALTLTDEEAVHVLEKTVCTYRHTPNKAS